MAALATALLAPTGAHAATTIYSNDFSAGLGGFTTNGVLRNDNGEAYIGNLTQGGVASLTVNTTGYQNLALSFDLYAVLLLDGNNSPDPFRVISNGNSTVFDYTLANYGGNTQTFGGQNAPVGVYAKKTGNSGTGRLGFGSGDFGDTEYALNGISVTSVNNVLTLTFRGDSNQDVTDEFYGIDNVRVTGDIVPTSAVPEPASWAMMIIGLGMVGAGLRYRTRKNALRYI